MSKRILFAIGLSMLFLDPAFAADLAAGKSPCGPRMSCLLAGPVNSTLPPQMSLISDIAPGVCVDDVMGVYKQNDVAICEAFLDNGSGSDRERAAALVNLGHAYRMKPGQYQYPVLSLQSWDRAIAADPSFAEPWVLKGDIAFEQHKDDEAVADYDRALALDPKHWRALMGKSRAFVRRGQIPDALALARAAVDAAPDVSIAHQLLGALIERQGNLTEALEEYRKATELDHGEYRRLPGINQEPSPWSVLASAEMRLGHVERAIDAISHEIDGKRVQNVSPDIFMQRGQYLEAAGRFTDAADDYEKSLMDFGANFPNADEIRTRIAMLRAKAGDSKTAQANFHDLLRSGKLQSILRVQVFLRNNGFNDIEIDGKMSATLEKALDRCLSQPDCSVAIGQSI